MNRTNSPTRDTDDEQWMRAALTLARRGLGAVWPNPAVGCILVGDGRVVGRGWTQPGGRPHAETEAIKRAGDLARGAVAYVTLEPCAHAGETPPCADALIKAAVARAVIAIEDPDPRTAGAGLKKLRDAGIAVVTGVGAAEARRLNEGFLTRLEKGRPLVTLKTATTLDGRVATASGDSKWITGPLARAFAHGLRAEHDAIMVGIGTVLADDPMLTCRLPGLEGRSPVRIVADSRLRLSPDCALAKTAKTVPTWVLTAATDGAERKALEKAGVEVIDVAAGADGRLDLAAALTALGDRGLTRLLVESGGELAASLVAADLVDRLAWFRSPRLIGGDGRGALAAFGVDALAKAPAFGRDSVSDAGDDVLETYRRAT